MEENEEYTVQDLQDNLNYLDETKTQIKNAIITKGQSVAANDTFRSYVNKILAIETSKDYNNIPIWYSKLNIGVTTIFRPNVELHFLCDNTSSAIESTFTRIDDYSTVRTAPMIGDVLINETTAYLNPETQLINKPYITFGIITNIETSDNTNNYTYLIRDGISREEYAELIGVDASDIREGVSILGVTGTLEEGIDTSDATADANDIINPKTAYARGNKLTGAIIPTYVGSGFILPYTYVNGNRTVVINNLPETTTKHFIIQDWDYNGWYILLTCIDENFSYYKVYNNKWWGYDSSNNRISDNNKYRMYKANSQSADVSWYSIGSGNNTDGNWISWFGGSDSTCYNSDETLFYSYPEQMILISLQRNGTLYRDTADANAIASNILLSKTAYVNGNKVIGSMPNNGVLSYTPTNSQQIIPAGYTSGGTIAAVEMTDAEYNNAISIVDDILGDTPYLPYIPLTYIESTGTQWIDTGIVFGANYSIEIKVDVPIPSAEKELFGVYSNDSNNRFMMARWGTKQLNFYYKTSNDNTVQVNNNTQFVITVGNGVYRIEDFNGSVYNNTTLSAGSQTSYTMPIFARKINSSTTVSNNISMKLYYCKIYNGNNLVKNLIPVKKRDNNAICMYDLVSQEFLYNNGTGTFIAGPEIN